MEQTKLQVRKILIVEDSPLIHQFFREILHSPKQRERYSIDSVYQGQAGIKLLTKAVQAHDPYALAFIDLRLPPGVNGIETIKKFWKIDPQIGLIIFTAYAEETAQELAKQFKQSYRFLIFKKPSDPLELYHAAELLITNWEKQRAYDAKIVKLTQQIETYKINLKKADNFLHTTLESIDQDRAIILVNPEDKIQFFNHKFLKICPIKEATAYTTLFTEILDRLIENIIEGALLQKTIRYVLNNRRYAYQSQRIWQSKNGNYFSVEIYPQYLEEEYLGVLLSFKDVTLQKTLEEQLSHQATHDLLTNLPNRVLYLDRLGQLLKKNRSDADKLIAILIIDLNNFRKVNDGFGYEAGDLILKEVAHRLEAMMSPQETVARLGGDEFGVLTEQLNEDLLILHVNRLLKALARPYTFQDQTMTITVSIGISIYPTHGKQMDELLQKADFALYAAKSQGQNSCEIYQGKYKKAILKQVKLEHELHLAVEKKELIIEYQPIVDIQSEKIVSLEALLRWHHPTLGIISPLDFIPLAEETGLIIPIGNWIVQQVALQIKQWLAQNIAPVHVAINISGQQFQQDSFIDNIKNILLETQVNPDLLEFELTESRNLGTTEAVRSKMLQVRQLGIHLVIDDFGTGYASLTYLQKFPFEKVKIDKTFIQGMDKNTEDMTIVKAILAMSNSLNLTVVAEGVETYDQLAFLKVHGGHQVQGYLFHKPLPKEACLLLLQKNNLQT